MIEFPPTIEKGIGMSNPRAFISYSHDSEEHKTWVMNLATQLRENGVDASIDQWDLRPGADMAAFMHDGVSQSDRVILVCTPTYCEKADAGTGGVGYEKLIVTKDLVETIDTRKFIPVVRNNPEIITPIFLGPRIHIDFNDDRDFDAKLDELLRDILEAPEHIKPDIGPSPYSGLPPDPPSLPRKVGATGVNKDGIPILESEWFVSMGARASELTEQGLFGGGMEIRFALHDSISNSQVELRNAVRAANIHTFGWPIGVMLENKPEFSPKPFSDGVRAEVLIPNEGSSNEFRSLDYWVIRNNGDFYLFQSYFEDRHSRCEVPIIYFNTQIVRVAEALLFANRLYNDLQVLGSVHVSFSVRHTGLAGRILGSSSPNRDLFETRKCSEGENLSVLITTVDSLRVGFESHAARANLRTRSMTEAA